MRPKSSPTTSGSRSTKKTAPHAFARKHEHALLRREHEEAPDPVDHPRREATLVQEQEPLLEQREHEDARGPSAERSNPRPGTGTPP
jgi:hypothetical protein